MIKVRKNNGMMKNYLYILFLVAVFTLSTNNAVALTVENNSDIKVTVTIMHKLCNGIAYGDANVCFSDKLSPKRSSVYHPLPVLGRSGFKVHFKDIKRKLRKESDNLHNDAKVEYDEKSKKEENRGRAIYEKNAA